MASPKPSNLYPFTISSPWRSQPGSVARPFWTSSSVSFAMSSSSSSGLFSLPQNLVQFQDLAGRHHADEPAAAVDNRQTVDVGRLHGLHRPPQRPLGPAD